VLVSRGHLARPLPSAGRHDPSCGGGPLRSVSPIPLTTATRSIYTSKR